MAKKPKRVTIKTIAEKAGVSEATVSLALANKGRISSETRERVLAIARTLDYRPNEAARALALKRYHEVGDETRAVSYPTDSVRYTDIDELLGMVEAEIAQLQQEGYDTSPIDTRAMQVLESPTFESLSQLSRDLKMLSRMPHYPYVEPSTLEEIRKHSCGFSASTPYACNSEVLADRILGGWLGRTAGCILGKPFEGLTRERIAAYLELAGSDPLDNYVPEVIPLPEGYELAPFTQSCMLGNIDGAAPDDDLDFTVLCLHVLEEYGLDLTTENIATEWLNHLPFFSTFTAERAAYRNLVNDFRPPYTAMHKNPWREFIGAQIRAECWGWVSPGNPDLATELAYKDARLSHVKNGIYGAMFVSSMLSMAPIIMDIPQLIQIGLSYVPSRSRFAEAVRHIVDLHGRFPDSYEQALEWLENVYGSYNPVHVLPNACIVAMALLYGKGDFSKSLSIAVTAGWDTDCNGATTGALLGTILGASAIPDKWITPLNDTIYTNVGQFSCVGISDCAERTLLLAEEFSTKDKSSDMGYKHPSVVRASNDY